MASRQWTRVDDKKVEEALLRFPDHTPHRLEVIADYLQFPLKDVMYYYDALVHDIDLIESGRVSVPVYPDNSGGISSQSNVEKDRKRGLPWSEEEHGNFLKGLQHFKKGDWKEISRVYVKTRTATQVASHAQKYFLRQNLESKAKKRSSIHDITSVPAKDETVPAGSDLDSSKDQPLTADLDSTKDQPHTGDLDSTKDQPHTADLDSVMPHIGDLDSTKDQQHIGDLDSTKNQPHIGDLDMPHTGDLDSMMPHIGDLDSMMPHIGDFDSMMGQPHIGDLDSLMNQPYFGDLDSMMRQPLSGDLDSMMNQPHIDSMMGKPHIG
ncbi:hypothetical protein EUTSA_v10022186mg [Eutrema salsugineum]|uniref:Uncharacterized protein n=1 Tax=Eutrema salsugineum TaxID=72664 RepID=V4NQW2_EUTSA|nr:hypothetical protein EUTSA_v10022186mg [Eutrema salsugineum]